MKRSTLLFTIVSCWLAPHSFAEDQQKKPVYRDAETHDLIVKKLKVSNNHNPMKTLVPAEGEDPSAKNRPQDIVSSSDVISFGGLTTLVPKKAIIKVPEAFANRLNNHIPGNRIVGWTEFFRLNRGWITAVEVSREEAEGRVAISAAVTENLAKSRNLIIATYSSGPISLLELKEEVKTSPEK